MSMCNSMHEAEQECMQRCRLHHSERADAYMGDDGMGSLQATDVKTDTKLLTLWRQYREGLYLQVKVERPELIIDKKLLFMGLQGA